MFTAVFLAPLLNSELDHGLIAGNYNFTVSGAAGGNAANAEGNGSGFGGHGATISGTLNLSSGQQICIVVGQCGDSSNGQQPDSGGEGGHPFALPPFIPEPRPIRKDIACPVVICKAHCRCSDSELTCRWWRLFRCDVD